jgi:YVTN family beta-propeller protein
MVRPNPAPSFPGRSNGSLSRVGARTMLPVIRRALSLLAVASIVAATSGVSVTSADASVAGPTVIATITVGAAPWGVAFSPDGTKAYVGNSGGHTISVIDVETRHVTTVTGGILNSSGPAGVAVAPDGSKVLFTAYSAAFDIAVAATAGIITMSTADLSVAASGVGCVNPLGITMRSDGTQAYVGCSEGRIRAVSTSAPFASAQVYEPPAQGEQVRDIAYVPRGTKAADDIASIRNVVSGTVEEVGGYFRLQNAGMVVKLPGYGMSVAVDRDGTRAYAGDETGVLSVFDIVNRTLLHTITVGGDLRGIALSHDGSLAYVTDHVGNSLKVVDLAGGSVTHTVPVGAGALRVALSPDGTRALVTNNSAGTVTLLGLPVVTPAAAPASSPADYSALLREVSCSPEVARAGSPLTCTVSGGEGLAGAEILWRAAYNPVIAEAGVTLDASGSGTFAFMVPAAAVGQVLTVELVDWAAPVALGTVGGPVPTAVRSGGGPLPLWPLLALPLAFLPWCWSTSRDARGRSSTRAVRFGARRSSQPAR